MNLIIGNVDHKMQMFIRENNFVDKTLVINKMCNVKYITERVVIYLPFGLINKFGLLNETMVHIEELIVSLNVVKVFYGDIRNYAYLNKLSNMYGIEIEKINYKLK